MQPIKLNDVLCEYKSQYKSVHTVITPRLRDDWVDMRLKEHVILCDNDNVQISYNTKNGLFLLCFPDVLMVDFDTDDKMNKDQALEKLQKYVQQSLIVVSCV